MDALNALLDYDDALPLEVYRSDDGQICVSYRFSYVKHENCLIYMCGQGSMFIEACEDYVRKINGKTLSFVPLIY